MQHIKKLLIVVGISVMVAPALSLAAYVNVGKDASVRSSNAIGENAYVVGGNVTVSSAMKGDLFVAGGMVVVSSKVDQDLMMVGGTLTVDGGSASDIRFLGGNVTIGGLYSGEMVGMGGNITVTSDALITKDSWLRGGTIVFDGSEKGNLELAGGKMNVNGTIEGNLVIKEAQSITLGSGAIIKGNFEYAAISPATIDSGVKISGKTIFHKVIAPQAAPTEGQNYLLGLITFWWFLKLVGILVTAYILWGFFRKDVAVVLSRALGHFWQETLRGFSFMVLVPVASIILCATVLGIMPAIIAMLVYVVVLILAVPFAGLVLASLMAHRQASLKAYQVFLGTLVFGLLQFVPIVGWIACLLIYLVALGSFLSVLRTKFQRR